MKPRNVLILPGWQNSGPEHWQSLWEKAHGYQRVEQHDWMRPLRGDWIARLEDMVLACDEPAVLVAHSLGCMLTAAWSVRSKNTHRVKAALLVAPGDVERPGMRDQIPTWSPIDRDSGPTTPRSNSVPRLKTAPITMTPTRIRSVIAVEITKPLSRARSTNSRRATIGHIRFALTPAPPRERCP